MTERAERAERTVKIDHTPVPDVYRSNVPQDDPVAFFKSRAYRAREKAVAVQETLILQERVKQCYMREGVNHYRNCKKETREYFEKIKKPNFME